MTDNTPTASQLASILGAKEKSNLSDELHNLLFGVRRSVYYHLHMRNFYDRFNLLCSSILISVFGYCYSLLKTSGGEQIAPLAAVLVTVLFMLNLAVRSLWKARLYHDFYRRFVALEKSIVATHNVTADELSAWTIERLIIEADEPPILLVLNAICHNRLAREMGYGIEHCARITFYQRWLSSVVDIAGHKIKVG